MSMEIKIPAGLASKLIGFSQRAGWPVLAGLLAFFIGLALLLGAWQVKQETRHLGASTPPSTTVDAGYVEPQRQFARATEAVFTIPEDKTHLDDLDKLFKLAKSKGVQIGTVEYRQSPNPALQALVRTLDIRMVEDYPRLKGFVAELLSSMPHVSLQEIRVERKDSSATHGQVLLKLSFVYRASVVSSPVSKLTP